MQSNSIQDASNYLVDTWRRYKDDGEKLCSYGIALAAYTLPAATNVSQQMLVELKSRIQQRTGNAWLSPSCTRFCCTCYQMERALFAMTVLMLKKVAMKSVPVHHNLLVLPQHALKPLPTLYWL